VDIVMLYRINKLTGVNKIQSTPAESNG